MGRAAIVPCSDVRPHHSQGGAIFTSGGETAVLTSQFFNNTADSTGGAVHSSGQILGISECQLWSNSAALGGAVHVDAAQISWIQNSSLTNNTATLADGGGGFRSPISSSLIVSYSKMTCFVGSDLCRRRIQHPHDGRYAQRQLCSVVRRRDHGVARRHADAGVQLCCGKQLGSVVLASMFSRRAGGASAVTHSRPRRVRCAATHGGGMVTTDYAQATIWESSFSGNSAQLDGGSLRIGEGSYVEIYGSHFLSSSAPSGLRRLLTR